MENSSIFQFSPSLRQPAAESLLLSPICISDGAAILITKGIHCSPPPSASPLAAALSLLRVLLADGTGASSAHWLFLEEEESDSPAGSRKRPNHGSMTNPSVGNIPKASIKVVLIQPALLGGKKGAEYGPRGLHYCLHMDQVCPPHTAELCKLPVKSLLLYCNLRFRES